MIAAPDGLTPSQFRSHPVRQVIADSAFHGERGLPTEAELDELGLPANLRSRVKKACEAVAQIHSRGDHAEAWAAGDEEAASIINRLTPELRHPRKPRPEEGISDPRELADLVPPMYST